MYLRVIYRYSIQTFIVTDVFLPRCGFITKNDQRGHRGVPGERGYKALGSKRKDVSDEEAEARACSFLQKDGMKTMDKCGKMWTNVENNGIHIFWLDQHWDIFLETSNLFFFPANNLATFFVGSNVAAE